MKHKFTLEHPCCLNLQFPHDTVLQTVHFICLPLICNIYKMTTNIFHVKISYFVIVSFSVFSGTAQAFEVLSLITQITLRSMLYINNHLPKIYNLTEVQKANTIQSLSYSSPYIQESQERDLQLTWKFQKAIPVFVLFVSFKCYKLCFIFDNNWAFLSNT